MTADRGFPAGGDQDQGATAPLRLQILGPLRVWRGDVERDAGPRQQRCLLALLVARESMPISTTTLVELIWGLDAPASALNVIHKYVGALRRLLEPGLPLRSSGAYILRHGSGYRFVANAEMLDLVAFRRLVAGANSSLGQGADEAALDQYIDALRLCHGTAGEALADSAAAAATLAGIDSEFFDAAVAAAGLAVRFRRAAQVLAPLRLAAKMSRLNEPVHASLVTTLAAAGHQAEALTVYQAIRASLAEELGIDPGHELQEAQRRVLTQTVQPSDESAPVDHDRRATAAGGWSCRSGPPCCRRTCHFSPDAAENWRC